MLLQFTQQFSNFNPGDTVEVDQKMAGDLIGANFAIPVPRGDTNALAAALKRAPNQITLNDPCHSFGDWLACVKERNNARLEAEYNTKTPMRSDSGTAGGCTVPTEFLPVIRKRPFLGRLG